MNWRVGAILGLAAFVLVCGWWLVQGARLYVRLGDVSVVLGHAEMADAATVLSRALAALLAACVAGAYIGGRVQVLVREAIEQNEAFTMIAAELQTDVADDPTVDTDGPAEVA